MLRSASVHSQIRRHKYRPGLELMEDRLTPSTLVVEVTSVIDSNAPKSGSLRNAITVCNNSDPGFDGRVIEIKTPGEYSLKLNGSDEDNNATGDLDILQSVTIINDTNGGSVTIDANGLSSPDRIFDIGPNGAALSVELQGVTIQNGSAPAGGAIRVPSPSDLTLQDDVVQDNTAGGGGGGAVFMLDGDLTLAGTTIRDNKSAGSGGGGVFQAGNGALTINNSLITGNQAQGTTGEGGGVRYDGTGDVKIVASQFTGNTAVNDGGGFVNTNNAALAISSTSFNNNRSNGDGGGIFLATGVASSLTNVTISNNVAQVDGGGLFDRGSNGGVITLQNDTIAFNTAESDGGVFDGDATMRLINTVIAQNLSAVNGNPDVGGISLNDIVDVGNNFIGNNLGTNGFLIAGAPNAHGSFVGSSAAPLDPLLGPLSDNGRFGQVTLTHADLPNSGNNGVRDRGQDAGAPTTDELGQPRVSGAHTDIGAFEFQNPDTAVSVSGPTGTIRAGAPLTLGIVVTNNGPNTSSGVVLGVSLPANTTVVSASVGFSVSGNVVNLAVPDLAKSANATITLTVTPNAPGSFTATATLGADPDLTNNTAAVSVTVLPTPFPAKGSADVTTLVQVKLLSPRKRAKRETFRITNTSDRAIQGPLGLIPVVSGGVKLKNASGQLPNKQKFVRLSVGADNILDPGETTSIQLVFSKAFLPRRFKVLAGAFA